MITPGTKILLHIDANGFSWWLGTSAFIDEPAHHREFLLVGPRSVFFARRFGLPELAFKLKMFGLEDPCVRRGVLEALRHAVGQAFA